MAASVLGRKSSSIGFLAEQFWLHPVPRESRTVRHEVQWQVKIVKQKFSSRNKEVSAGKKKVLIIMAKMKETLHFRSLLDTDYIQICI